MQRFAPIRWSLPSQVILALIAGILMGILGGTKPYLLGMTNKDIGQIGMLIIRLLKALAVPLILFSILDAFIKAPIGLRSGLRLITICMCNLVFAMVIGLGLMNWLKPGVAWQGQIDQLIANVASASSIATPAKPGNISLDPLQNPGGFIPQSLIEPILNNNVISVVLIALLFGGALVSLKRNPSIEGTIDSSGLENLIAAIHQLLVVVLGWVVKFVPLAVLCLVAQAVGGSGIAIFSTLAGFLGIITLGLCVHGLVYYPIAAWLGAGLSPQRYLGIGADAVLTGMSTNSSLATVPITLGCLRRMGIHDHSARIAVCAGTNLNNDGVTLYEAMTAIFLAQAIGFDLEAGQQILIVLAALMAGIGIAGIPEAGLIALPLVLGAAGLPETVVAAAIPLIAPVDWILARLRSAVNVLSDMLVAILLDAWEKRTQLQRPLK